MLNSGIEIDVTVTHTDSLNVYGTQTYMAKQRTEILFKESYTGLGQNASHIAVKKFSPLLTAVAVIVPVAILSGTAIYYVSYPYTLLAM